ncbi:right-handed parallel beta-helix repeat-containing protein, partial [Chelativorans oligotrophicus]
QVASPKLALANGLTADALTIAAGANDTTIRNIGIFGTTANSGNGISGSGVLTGLRIEGNVIGVLPDQSSAAGTVGNGILLDSNTNGSFTIANNYIADSRGFGGILATSNTHVALGSYIISGNQIVDAGSDAINLGSSSHVTVSGNLLQRFTQSGVDLIFNKGFNLVEHNTIAEGSGPQPEGGVRLLGDTSSDSNRSNIVRFNKLVNNAGTRHAGITVSRLGAGNRLTENQFGGNSGNAIDNIDGTGSLPDGVTVRTGCTTNTVPLGRPVLSSAILVDNTLRLEGSYCGSGTYRLELYKVAPGSAGDMGADGLQAGEGGTFLAALTGLSGGTLDETLSPAPGNLVAGSDHITAILIRETATGGAVGDTSEFSANVLAVSVPFVTLAKVSTGGTGSFIFNGSAANANGFPTDDTYSLATTAQDVAVEGAPVPLA